MDREITSHKHTIAAGLNTAHLSVQAPGLLCTSILILQERHLPR